MNPSIDEAGLRGLLERATPGPWRFERHSNGGPYFGNIIGSYGLNERGNEKIRTITCQLSYGQADENEANAELIAAARSALPTLLDELSRLRKALEPFALHETCGCFAGQDDSEPADLEGHSLLVRDFRAARSALNQETDHGG